MIRSAKSGFTLIELAIVLCIIAILVAIAALNFNGNVAKAETGALNALGSQMRTACAMELSELMDTNDVSFLNFVEGGGNTVADLDDRLVTLPASCGAGVTGATSVTCIMTKRTGTYTYIPATGEMTIAVADNA
jgi:prepilin-type N-terminal cleavage/methylation domain-containing protein